MNLATHNPRTTQIRIEALDLDLTLRPLPISVSRDVSKSLKHIAELIQKVSRQSATLQQQIALVTTQFSSDKITEEQYLEKLTLLSDKLLESTPDDLDWQTAESIASVFTQLLAFYDNPLSKSQVESKVTMSDMVDVLQAQLDLNSDNDFLLGPLRALLALIKRVPQEMNRVMEQTQQKAR